jgi:hypothetical protein
VIIRTRIDFRALWAGGKAVRIAGFVVAVTGVPRGAFVAQPIEFIELSRMESMGLNGVFPVVTTCGIVEA